MQLIFISLLISSIFSGIIIKTNPDKPKKQPISNRRHTGNRERLLTLDKDLSNL